MNSRDAGVVITVLLLTASSAAQVADDTSGSSTSWRSCLLKDDVPGEECLFLGPPVLDAPFSADVVTTWQPPAASGMSDMRTTARYHRDRHGRLRVERTYVNGAAAPIFLTDDAEARRVWVLDPRTRTAHRTPRGAAEMMIGAGGSYRHFVLALAPNRWMSFHRLPTPSLRANTPFDERSLGERIMAGVRLRGTEYTAMLPPGAMGRARSFEMSDERWVSPELKVVVFSRSEDPHIGLFEYRLANIRRDDPPSELFAVPPDFTETQPLDSMLKWENPYTLSERRSRTQ
jgi:hypothetical protein